MEEIIQQITTKEKLGRIKTIQPVSGGSVNLCYHVTTNLDEFFLKMNDNIPADFFEVEYKSLSILDMYARTPRTRNYGVIGGVQYLVMDWVKKEPAHPKATDDLAFTLSQLHRQTREDFGLDYNNYIGRLYQRNTPHKKWSDFFAEERLLPLVKLAVDDNLLTKDDVKKFEKVAHKLEELIPVEKPSLLHGDLWNGNFILAGSRAFLIDPAIYFGHREMDLAMTQLFGGFPDRFYEVYEDGFKLSAGWEDRVSLFQLYPLLVHLIIFGKSYHASIKESLNKYL